MPCEDQLDRIIRSMYEHFLRKRSDDLDQRIRDELRRALCAREKELEERAQQLRSVLGLVSQCPLMHDENGHAYLKVDARSINGTGAAISAVLAATAPREAHHVDN